jgi:DNA helicase MCM8
VEYARNCIRPRLSVPAAKVLQQLYLTMRAQAALGHSIPVTTRHLESLIRLAQARSRLELRVLVTEQDARDVVELLQESLLQAFTDETGAVDLGRSSGGPLVKQIKKLVEYLRRESDRRNNDVFHSRDIEAACAVLRLDKDPKTVIERMHSETYLLKKGPSMWQLNCA